MEVEAIEWTDEEKFSALLVARCIATLQVPAAAQSEAQACRFYKQVLLRWLVWKEQPK
jgi:hypothetical protein